MSYNYNCNQSQSNQSFQPFMMGGQPYGCGVNPSASHGSMGNRGRESVRSSMQWSDSGSGRGNSGRISAPGGYWSQPGMQQQQQQANYCGAQPKAFLTAVGGGEGSGVSIPVQMAPMGTDPSTLLKNLEPVTLKVKAPQMNPANQKNAPYAFTIDPSQIYGNLR